jgi:hypothetical protein
MPEMASPYPIRLSSAIPASKEARENLFRVYIDGRSSQGSRFGVIGGGPDL